MCFANTFINITRPKKKILEASPSSVIHAAPLKCTKVDATASTATRPPTLIHPALRATLSRRYAHAASSTLSVQQQRLACSLLHTQCATAASRFPCRSLLHLHTLFSPSPPPHNTRPGPYTPPLCFPSHFKSLPTFGHFLIFNKFSLFSPLSLSFSSPYTSPPFAPRLLPLLRSPLPLVLRCGGSVLGGGGHHTVL